MAGTEGDLGFLGGGQDGSTGARAVGFLSSSDSRKANSLSSFSWNRSCCVIESIIKSMRSTQDDRKQKQKMHTHSYSCTHTNVFVHAYMCVRAVKDT